MSLKKSTEIGELSKALTAFQKSAPKIIKDKKGKIQLKSGASYEYDYADLASIWDKIRGSLADNGLSAIQSPTTMQGQPALTTLLAHESGQWVEDTMELKMAQDTPQGQGSAITYARRYALSAMLGIVADSDNDAQDHRVITSIQKKRLFDTAKRVMPELSEDPLSLVRFLSEVIGKHPSRLLEDEVEDAVQSVEAYTTQGTEDGSRQL